MNKLGLDLGSNEIKAVEVRQEKDKTQLLNIAKASSRDLNFFTDTKVDQRRALDFITDFVFQNKFVGMSVNISIPQSIIYTKISSFPSNLKGKELENAVNLEMEQDSPIKISEASTSFQILPPISPKVDTSDVLIVIAPSNYTFRLLNVVKDAGLNVSSIEPESFSTIRGVINETKDDVTTLILDIGRTHSNIVIYAKSALRFTRTITSGFDSLTKAAAQELNLEMIQAQEYISAYGFLSDKLSGKIKNSISPVYNIMLNEMRRAITFFESRNPTTHVKRVILTGGGALIPGILIHTANFINAEVQIANPWTRLNSLGKYEGRERELLDIGPVFTVATGLSLKSSGS